MPSAVCPLPFDDRRLSTDVSLPLRVAQQHAAMLYRSLIRPLLFKCQPETAHHLTMSGLKHPLLMGNPLGRQVLKTCYRVRDASLEQTLWDRQFTNPVGLAAGLDKNAEAINAFAAVGFSHVEVGTVTGQAQPGNEQPRLFRLVEDEGIINRMGFNNQGCEAIAARLSQQFGPAEGYKKAEHDPSNHHPNGLRRPATQLGINLGKTKIVPLEEAADDYHKSITALGPLADYIVINVSSPNTPGLRDLQAEASLRPLLETVRQAVNQYAPQAPLLLKIAPDLAEAGIDSAVDVALETGCNGIIATNTTITRSNLQTSEQRICDIGAGGLSGNPLTQMSQQVLAQVARRVDGRVPVIGVGGIHNAETAWQRICHGASLIQIYSALVFQGPLLVKQINQGLVKRLKEHGLGNISEAVGRDL